MWALVLLVVLPGVGSAAVQGLDRARTGLDEALVRVGQAADALDDTRADRQRLTADLDELRDDLDEAERRAEDAEETAAGAQAALAGAVGDLETQAAALTDAQQQVDDRAATMWMRGSATDQALLSGLWGATRLHDVAVRATAIGHLSDLDLVRLAESLDLTMAVARDRDATGRVRSLAAAATADAVVARRRAEGLVAEREGLLAAAADAEQREAALLAELEADVDARRALVTELSLRVQQQQLADLDAWLADQTVVDLDAPPPPWASALPAAGRQWAPVVVHAAGIAGVDPVLFAALVWTESGFRPGALSPAGAIGLAQLMPATARGLGVDPYDPLENLVGGATYLRQQLVRFGRVDHALAAYNAGPSRVEQFGGIPPIVETEVYVLRVLERVQLLQAAG